MSLDLDAIKARIEAASPGPWIAITDNGRKNGIGIVGEAAKRGTGQAIAVFASADSVQRNADAEFTAAAREDMHALVAALELIELAMWACVGCGYHTQGWLCRHCGRALVPDMEAVR